jgi:hypothetical protein
MINTTSKIPVISFIVIVVVVAFFFLYKRQTGREKVSRFGKYQGYTEKVYEGTRRVSDYITLSGGTRQVHGFVSKTCLWLRSPMVWEVGS